MEPDIEVTIAANTVISLSGKNSIRLLVGFSS